MEYGIVYLLTNPVMPGLVKIGMTTQEDIDKRMKLQMIVARGAEKIKGWPAEI